MTRLSQLLEKNLYKQAITPIIVKTRRIDDLLAEIRQILPKELQLTYLKSLFPKMSTAMITGLASLKVIRTFNMIRFPATNTMIQELAQDRRVEKLYLDRVMTASQTVPLQGQHYDRLAKKTFTTTYWTRQLLGLDKADKDGINGKGITVAVLDTGAGVHEQLLTDITRTTTIAGQYSDGSGHGTHVITTIGGRPTQDPYFRVFVQGMIQGASIISIKTLGWLLGIGRESDVFEGLEIALKNNAHIVNMSLGTEQVPTLPEEDPFTDVITSLTRDYGMIVCIAAGNAGPEPGSISSPGSVPAAFTVGAWDPIQDKVADFSGRGPVWDIIKPDVVAPGVNIDSGIVGMLDVEGDKKPQRYSYLSGTSMATPHVAGLIAAGIKLFRTQGKVLTRDVLEDVCKQHGHEKDNNTGYGFITYDWFKSTPQKF